MKLSEKQQKKLCEVAREHRLKLLLLFGSQSDGRTHPESDVDVAYLPEKSLAFEEERLLNYELTNIFGVDRVDTADMRKASPLLSYAIFRHPQILFQQDALTFPTYQAYAFKKYVEAKPLYAEKFRRMRIL